jgi:hypothetical protein
MTLIQVLLPMYDNDGRAFPNEMFDQVRKDLTSRFGGLTAFTRAPAEGFWKADGKTKKDDIAVLEIMTDQIDRQWWSDYRQRLESVFRQKRIIIRAQATEVI